MASTPALYIMECPLCESPSNFVFPAKGINILDCDNCDHRFAQMDADEESVEVVYDDGYFNGGGAGYPDYNAEADLLIKRGQMYADRIKRYTQPGRMLDVGSACGYILKGFLELGWRGIGLEPNESMVRGARTRLGVPVLQGTLESIESHGKFDLITMIQVVGHFYDPVKAFTTAHSLLEDNGLMLIEGWNREALSARMFGQRWHEYSPPSVRQWYSPDSLTEFLDRIGFEKIAHGRPPKHISGRHAKSLLKYHVGSSRIFDVIPDTLTIPYFADDLYWILYRKR